MVPFAGWEMPVQYKGITEEHKAVRTAAKLLPRPPKAATVNPLIASPEPIA